MISRPLPTRREAMLVCAGRKGHRARDARLLADMRRYLRQLPETQHPLDR